jgi:hypothetical protein
MSNTINNLFESLFPLLLNSDSSTNESSSSIPKFKKSEEPKEPLISPQILPLVEMFLPILLKTVFECEPHLKTIVEKVINDINTEEMNKIKIQEAIKVQKEMNKVQIPKISTGTGKNPQSTTVTSTTTSVTDSEHETENQTIIRRNQELLKSLRECKEREELLKNRSSNTLSSLEEDKLYKNYDRNEECSDNLTSDTCPPRQIISPIPIKSGERLLTSFGHGSRIPIPPQRPQRHYRKNTVPNFMNFKCGATDAATTLKDAQSMTPIDDQSMTPPIDDGTKVIKIDDDDQKDLVCELNTILNPLFQYCLRNGGKHRYPDLFSTKNWLNDSALRTFLYCAIESCTIENVDNNLFIVSFIMNMTHPEAQSLKKDIKFLRQMVEKSKNSYATFTINQIFRNTLEKIPIYVKM